MPKEYIERGAFMEILKETKNDCEHYHNKVVCDFAIKMATYWIATAVLNICVTF